jgi:hypothetical protein
MDDAEARAIFERRNELQVQRFKEYLNDMSSLLPSEPTVNTYASPVLHGGHYSWQISQNHPMLDNSGNFSALRSHETSIDPQLQSQETFGVTRPPGQQLYPLSSPHNETARSAQSSHSRNGSLQLPSIEGNVPRNLPSQDVTDEKFDDAYVSFIFYCNPAIPSDTDTQELRKAFRSAPKSDGKNFSTFTLFELIRKLELKEIKTWAQLAIDLGVEPPAIEKGQSAQKVQQYAVRLKVRCEMLVSCLNC